MDIRSKVCRIYSRNLVNVNGFEFGHVWKRLGDLEKKNADLQFIFQRKFGLSKNYMNFA